MAAVGFEFAADTVPFLVDKMFETLQGQNTTVRWNAVGKEGLIGCSLLTGYTWIVLGVPVVLGNTQLVVDIETEFVEIAVSPRDTHSVETVQYSRATAPGEDGGRNSPAVDSSPVENCWQLVAVVRWAGLEEVEGSTAS